MNGFGKVFLGIALICPLLFARSFEEWLPEQTKVSWENLLRNINPLGTVPGVVVASPSRHNPDYWYHWVRDAALVMDVVLTRYERTVAPEEKGRLLRLMLDYLQFSRQNQLTETPSGGPGEPKFHVNGAAFTEPWGRPQDDGPALRALVLTRFTKMMMAEGGESVSGIRQDAITRATTVIKLDLDYVASHWTETSFDLWEEIRGHHFFTRMVQRKALSEGALLAALMGEPDASEHYSEAGRRLEAEISNHWDPSRKYLVENLHRDGGISHKNSGLDAATVLGVLHGATSDGIFGVTDERVMATVERLHARFAEIYPINRQGPGTGIGRYPEDTYDGYSTAGMGNPWVLLTNAFAEYYYRLARELMNREEMMVTEINHRFFKSLGINLPIGALRQSDRAFGSVIQALREKGDQYLRRTHYHADPNGQLSEQMNRWTGFMQGARDLTWSYATLLTAVDFR